MSRGAIQRGIAVAVVVLLSALSVPALALPPFEPEAVTVRSCIQHPDAALAAALLAPTIETLVAQELADERLTGVGIGLSVWVEGYGEVSAVNPDFRFRPASNQKILTAMAVLEYIGPDTRLTTSVMTNAPVTGSTIEGDVALVGGGDPTLGMSGRHSLESLAAAVAASGVRSVTGDLVVDESRFDSLRTANGWSASWIPRWVGSLSALVVDENRATADASDISDPARFNGRRFRDALAAAGVTVDGDVQVERVVSDARVLVRTDSAPVRDIVGVMLSDSNNMYAETLLKEVGARHSGHGSTQRGLAAVEELVRSMCFPRSILQQDGSGLSDGNARPARQWRQVVQSAQRFDWWQVFLDSLAIAGESGTLTGRFVGTPVAGNMRAKTGSISGLRSLSGTFSTAGGRTVFFAAVVDTPEPRPAMAAIDELLVALATDES